MKILASPHPFLANGPILFAPEPIQNAFSVQGMPQESWHLGFSRTGDFLYSSDNLPLQLKEIPTIRGIDPFFQILDSLIHPQDIPRVNDFRAGCLVEQKMETVFRVNRKDLTLPPRLALASRKAGDLVHFVFLPEGRGTEPESVRGKHFFARYHETLAEIQSWLDQIDEETLAVIAMGTFRSTYPEEDTDVVIRSFRGGILLQPAHRSTESLPNLPGDIHEMPRWWGTRINDSNDDKDVWVHTTLRCARAWPVMSISSSTGFIRRTGISRFRSTLLKMSGQILESARTFTWGQKYRYARQWLLPAGYDIRQADRILGVIRSLAIDSTVMIPIRANLQDLKAIFRKTRMDEPIFWDAREEQVWVTIRGTSPEAAETTVRPSLVSRLEMLVGSPIPVDMFLLRYCGKPLIPASPSPGSVPEGPSSS